MEKTRLRDKLSLFAICAEKDEQVNSKLCCVSSVETWSVLEQPWVKQEKPNLQDQYLKENNLIRHKEGTRSSGEKDVQNVEEWEW